MRNNVVVLLAGLLLGCTGASVIRTASAQGYPANPAAPRWEQYCHVVGVKDDDRALNTWLARVGNDGWELVGASPITTGSTFSGIGSTGMSGAFACFKRSAASRAP